MATPADPQGESPKLAVRTAALIGAIWAGIFGLSFAVSFLMPNQLFQLLVLALVVGALLTVAVLLFTLRLAQVVAGSGDDGGVVVVDGQGAKDEQTPGKTP